jgi:hypothetical protein
MNDKFQKNPGKPETWKVIDQYPNYEISTSGILRNKKSGKLLKQYKNKNKKREYPFVRIYNELGGWTTYVHQLMMLTFSKENPCCSLCGMKKQVNHKDGNKSNNNSTNLEYVTQQENIIHSMDKKRLKQKEWWENKNLKR